MRNDRGYETTVFFWSEIVVGSRPCSEGFALGSPVFLPSQEPTFPIRPVISGQEEPPCGMSAAKSNYYIIFILNNNEFYKS